MSLTECEPPVPVSVFLNLQNFHSSHEGSRRERKSRSSRRNSLTLPPTINEEPLSVADVEVRNSSGSGHTLRLGWRPAAAAEQAPQAQAAVLGERNSCCAVYPDRALCVRRARLVTYLSLAITLAGGGLGLFAAHLLNRQAPRCLQLRLDAPLSPICEHLTWASHAQCGGPGLRARVLC